MESFLTDCSCPRPSQGKYERALARGYPKEDKEASDEDLQYDAQGGVNVGRGRGAIFVSDEDRSKF